MDAVLRYRGRLVTSADVEFIRDLIASRPDASRRALSMALCSAWGWFQANGAPRDMVCRGLMLALDRAGHIELPLPRWRLFGPYRRETPEEVEVDRGDLNCRLNELGTLTFLQVRRTEEERLFNGLIEKHHYLRYTRPVGEHLKYLVYAGERPVACFAWSSAPRHLGPRDRYIGWSARARKENIRYLAYNSRFLILPWVKVKYLASHLLSQMAKVVWEDWERVYGHRVYYLETFVDPERFMGTCYRAANWKYLGLTTGRGKDDQTNRPNRSLKHVMGYPLTPDFRERLSVVL